MGQDLIEYVDMAAKTLGQFGIDIFQRADERETQLVKLLDDIASVDEPKVLAISQVLGQMSAYNDLVRENVSDMNVSVRYQEINELFQSIIDDTKMYIEHMKDGKLSLGERLQQTAMKVRRGDLHGRYDRIIDTANEVFSDTKKNIDLEEAILESYGNFRLGLKGAEVLAYEVLETQEKNLAQANEAWKTAQDNLNAYTGEKQSERSELEGLRDKAAMAQKVEDKKYGLIKKIAENLKVGYNTGEVVMAKLSQTHEVKVGLYESGIIFYTTNEHVLTGMSATHKSMLGNREAAETLKQTYEGMNNNLNYLAELGAQVDDTAIEVTHGKSIDPGSVGNLVNAIVEYTEQNAQKIAAARKEATLSAQEVERITNEGKQRAQEAILTYQPQN